MERKLMIAPSVGCCDMFDMERQIKIIDEKSDFLHMDIKDGVYGSSERQSKNTDGCSLND